MLGLRATLPALFALFATSAALGEDLILGPPNLDALRQLRAVELVVGPADALSPAESHVIPAPPPPANNLWTLTPEIAANSKGTFGIDFSRYETDDCKLDWSTVISMGLRFVHLEMTKGLTPFPSVLKPWQELEPLHAQKKLFRGAYHFLMPNDDLSTDATQQANAFLVAIGAVGGKKPIQLPPVVDIEPTKSPIAQGTSEYDNCERRTTDDGKQYYCDMWYKMKNPADIVTLTLDWANKVKQATGLQVMVYSGPNAWSQVVGSSGPPLSNGRAIWMARYTPAGSPEKGSSWGPDIWNAKWGMPVLLDSVPYPSPTYSVPHFWQFTQSGSLSKNPLTCATEKDQFVGKLDLSYIPVKGAQFEAVFSIH